MTKMTAVVTGGSSGIGLSIVKALVRKGYFVHFIGSNDQKGKAVESALNAGSGQSCRYIQLDMSNMAAVRKFTAEFTGQYQSLDLLCNVAGVMLPKRMVTDEGLEKTFAIGYFSSVLLCQAFRPLLAQSSSGRIVNVAGGPKQVLNKRLDLDDMQMTAGYNLMNAAIGAVHAKTVWTEILAEKYAGDGIDVNCFHPGAVKSDLFRNMRQPARTLFLIARLFMDDECKSGIYACTAQELGGKSGNIIIGKKAQPLKFQQAYKDRLWQETEKALEAASS